MAIWKFYEYVSTSGSGEITEWYESLSIKAQTKFDDVLAHLENLPREEWKRPEFDLMSGEEGLCEIRLKADNTQYRVFGVFGPMSDQFTLLIGCTEKNKKDKKAAYLPSSAKTTANKRKDEIIKLKKAAKSKKGEIPKPQRIQLYEW